MKYVLCGIFTVSLLPAASYVGNDACRPCHAALYRTYSATAMARSSGRVVSAPAGRFRAPDKTEYRIDDQGRVSFGAASKQLQWFIGSGAAGRSFVYASSGHLYQAPLTYYSQRAAWDVSPGYDADPSPRWNRAIDSNCLFCHASQTQPVYGTQNRFADPPWRQDGVGCERCHGPGSEHVAGRGRLVNPAKLDAARRDAVCSQCHLSGEARIDKPDRSVAMFRPGDSLSDYVAYFVAAGPANATVKATGYVEKLQSSRCKVLSGDKLWCGTCHDPHSQPEPAQAAAYFREKCLTCHSLQQCGRGLDCRTCHMPRAKAIDGGHGVLTDHSLPRRPTATALGSERSSTLLPFAGFTASDRELGLAYAETGVRANSKQQLEQALRLLTTVAGDRETLPRLADLYARRGDRATAWRLYTQALAANPHSVTVLVNLGALEAERGNLARARELWMKALDSNPGLDEAAINLQRVIEPGASPAQAAVQRAQRLRSGQQ